MEYTSNSFLKKLAGFSIGPFVSAIIGFITVPVTTYLVSPEDFGRSAMYTMGYTITSLFIFLGIDQAFLREYNEYNNKSQLFWNSIIIPLIFSLIIGPIYIIFNKPISLLMFDSIETYTVIILAISLPFSVISRFNMLVLRMEERAKIYSLLTIINKLLSLVILIMYLLFVDRSYKGIINATFISLIIGCFIESYYVKHIWKNNFKINKDLVIKIFRFGIPLIPASIIGWFFSSMDKIALREWSNFNEIGIYSAAFKVVGILTIIQSSFNTFWTPTAYRWHEDKVSNDKYKKVSEIILVIMCLVFSFIVLFKDIIIKLLSEDYKLASKSVPFLLFFPIMYTVSETTTLGIPFSRKTYYNIIISGVSAFVNYIGNYLLVPKFGSIGASISTGLSYIVFFFMRTLISRKLWFKFNMEIYIKNIILLLILSLASITINNYMISLIIISIIIYLNKNVIKEIIIIVKNIINEYIIKNKKIFLK